MANKNRSQKQHRITKKRTQKRGGGLFGNSTEKEPKTCLDLKKKVGWELNYGALTTKEQGDAKREKALETILDNQTFKTIYDEKKCQAEFVNPGDRDTNDSLKRSGIKASFDIFTGSATRDTMRHMHSWWTAMGPARANLMLENMAVLGYVNPDEWKKSLKNNESLKFNEEEHTNMLSRHNNSMFSKKNISSSEQIPQQNALVRREPFSKPPQTVGGRKSKKNKKSKKNSRKSRKH